MECMYSVLGHEEQLVIQYQNVNGEPLKINKQTMFFFYIQNDIQNKYFFKPVA